MQIAPSVFLARLDDRSVVLDLERDRYFAFNAPMTRGVLADLGLETTATPHERDAAAARMAAMGIRPDRPLRHKQLSPPPTKTIWATHRYDAAGDWSPNLADLIGLAETTVRLRLTPLRRTIAWTERRLAPALVGSCPACEVIDGYWATRPWFPQKPICRVDAISMSLALARAGAAPRLVFGVRLDPFHAHCWVEVEDAIVNEAYEDVGQYTPIMAVGTDRA